MTTKLLTTTEAATLLNVSPRTLEGWRVRGFGPSFKRLSAKAVRYCPHEVATWMNAQTFQHTSGYLAA